MGSMLGTLGAVSPKQNERNGSGAARRNIPPRLRRAGCWGFYRLFWTALRGTQGGGVSKYNALTSRLVVFLNVVFTRRNGATGARQTRQNREMHRGEPLLRIWREGPWISACKYMSTRSSGCGTPCYVPWADLILAGRDVLPQRSHLAQLTRLIKTPLRVRYQISRVACFRLIAPAVRTTAPGPKNRRIKS